MLVTYSVAVSAFKAEKRNTSVKYYATQYKLSEYWYPCNRIEYHRNFWWRKKEVALDQTTMKRPTREKKKMSLCESSSSFAKWFWQLNSKIVYLLTISILANHRIVCNWACVTLLVAKLWSEISPM